jgi:dipeptidyl-peptidase-4
MRASFRSIVSLAFAALGASACHAPHRVAKVAYEPALAQVADRAPVTMIRNAPSAAAEASATALRALSETRGHRLGVPHHFAFTKDESAVYFLRSGSGRDPHQSVFRVTVPEGREELVLSPSDLLKGPESLSPEERARRERLRIGASGFTNFLLAPDGRALAIELSGRLFTYDVIGKQSRELAPGTSVYDARFSPDGRSLAFVRDANVHRVEVATGRVVAITRGGTQAKPLGIADFAAQEELDRIEGYWWSPSSDALLVEEVDQREVERLAIIDPAHPERDPDRPYYPRAGRTNAVLGLAIHDAEGRSAPRSVRWDKGAFPYLAKVTWTRELGILLTVLDRPQKRLELLRVDETTGETTRVLAEQDAAWVNHDPSIPAPVPGTSRFLWASERSGHWQLELRERSGALALGQPLTLPEHGYGRVVHVTGTHAFVAASPDPIDDVVLRVALDGSRVEELAPREVRRQHTTVVSPSGAFRVELAASADAFATVVTLRGADDAPRATIRSLQESPARAPAPTFHTVGEEHYRVAVLRPEGFAPGRRYPVIDAAYGGPHAQVVQGGLVGYARAQWMADATGAIVVAIDAKGTPCRGRAWERAIEGDFGTLPVEGHVAALEALARVIPEMDLARVGVYGWSFGGYFAARAALARPDFFKAAVAGAPPVDWLDYDTAYTERYLGIPDPSVSHPAYDRSSLVPLAKRPVAPGETARPLLIVHGTADDNVHFKNALVLADALLRGGRPFELVPLVGTTHMLNDPALALPAWTRMASFLATHLAEGRTR